MPHAFQYSAWPALSARLFFCPQLKRGTFACILRAMTVRPNPTFSVFAGRTQAQMNISDGRRSVSRHNLEVDLRAFANFAAALSPSLLISFFLLASGVPKTQKDTTITLLFAGGCVFACWRWRRWRKDACRRRGQLRSGESFSCRFLNRREMS